MSASTFRVFVRGIEFYAYHGFSEEEQKIGHRYSLDLDARIKGLAPRTDVLTDTVDYGALATAAVEFAQSKQYRLVESLTFDLGTHLLRMFDSIEVLTLTMVKRLPPAPVIASEAGVSITLTQDDLK
jgi:dihydroneopterin aldolase